jgi:ketosteroid isomerase-like protein
MRPIVFLGLLFASIAQSMGSQPADPEKSKEEILRMHASDLAAIVHGDASDLASRLAPQLLSVEGGHIDRLTREALLGHMADSFRASQHHATDDLETPVIRVSADGTMAWAIFRTRYRNDEVKPGGKIETNESISASVFIYEKQDEKWLVTASATTEEPESSGSEERK